MVNYNTVLSVDVNKEIKNKQKIRFGRRSEFRDGTKPPTTYGNHCPDPNGGHRTRANRANHAHQWGAQHGRTIKRARPGTDGPCAVLCCPTDRRLSSMLELLCRSLTHARTYAKPFATSARPKHGPNNGPNPAARTRRRLWCVRACVCVRVCVPMAVHGFSCCQAPLRPPQSAGFSGRPPVAIGHAHSHTVVHTRTHSPSVYLALSLCGACAI